MKNEMRFTNVTLNYNTKISIEYIIKLKYFIDNYRHLDLPLNVMLNINNEIDENNLYDVVSILALIPQIRLSIRSFFLSGMTDKILDLIYEVFNEVVYRVDENFEDELEHLFYLEGKGNVLVELDVNENTIDFVNKFAERYRVMNMDSVYKINYFSKFKDPNNFMNKVKSIKEISGILYAKDNPNMTIHLVDDGTLRYFNNCYDSNGVIVDLKNDGIVINEEVVKNNISMYEKHQEKCLTCKCFSLCKGGNEVLFQETENEELFCTTQKIIVGQEI